MAQVVIGSDEVFNALVGGATHQRTIDFLRNQFSNVNTSVLSNAERRFYEEVNASVEQAIENDAMGLAIQAARKIRYSFDPESIRFIPVLEELQFAPIKMQRFIMANPVVRNAYIAGRIDGYSDTYCDMQPGEVGEHHYDYRRVVEGVVFDVVDESGEDTWEYTQYPDDLDSDDSMLTFDEQIDILNTWVVCEDLLQGEEDFTSVYGEDIKK